MVSPMFIALPIGLESSTSFGSWQHLWSVCRFIGLGSSLGTGEDPLTLLKVCPVNTDKAEIKCMGSIGGKTPTEPKRFVHYTLAFDTLNEIKLMFMHFAQSKYG